MLKLLLLLLCAFHVCAYAAEITIEGVLIHVTGHLRDSDLATFRSASESLQIKMVVFENSNGGTVKAGKGFADLIKLRNFDTVVKGACHSSCAYAFLSGKRRSFSSGSQTNRMLLHVGRKVVNGDIVEYSENDELMDQIDSFTRNRLTVEIKNLIRKSWAPDSGVLIISRDYYFFNNQSILYCDGSQGRDISKCRKIEGVDAKMLGILTD